MATVFTFASTYPSLKLRSPSIPLLRSTSHPIQSCNFSTPILPKTKFGFSSFGTKSLGFVSKSKSNDGEKGEEVNKSSEAKLQAPDDESTMPERFRYLTKEVPEPPLKWPYFIALGFLVYAWRTVLWELRNWKAAATAILGFMGYLSKLVLALIFHFIGDPITSTIRAIETTFYTLRAYYSQVVAYTPIPELSTVIMLTSAILAIGEVASPNSVDDQWHLLTASGLIGYLAVKGMIGGLLFWTLLFGLFSFSRFVQKRDYVSSVLPVAAVLAGVGEPWVRVVVLGGFSALGVVQYSKNQPEEGESESEGVIITKAGNRRVPVPLLLAALAIGIRVAARWAGYRHLTWMVV